MGKVMEHSRYGKSGYQVEEDVWGRVCDYARWECDKDFSPNGGCGAVFWYPCRAPTVPHWGVRFYDDGERVTGWCEGEITCPCLASHEGKPACCPGCGVTEEEGKGWGTDEFETYGRHQ